MKNAIYILFLLTSVLSADNVWERIVDLRGQWRFNLGDDLTWADGDYDDSAWEKIFAPAKWEDEGFPGYDGYAWYRTDFQIDKKHENRHVYVRLWQIDDVDEVYINGHLIGFYGSFPPDYVAAYAANRIYRIPVEYINFDKDNNLAVRVYDDRRSGGILRGLIGIYVRSEELEPEIPLEGLWHFMQGDNLEWKELNLSETDWKNIMVPAHWEVQGFKDYDGFAWYRKKVIVPEKLRGQDLIIFLGKIDDVDEFFFNGSLVGQTGSILEAERRTEGGEEYKKWRAYPLNSDNINYGSDNLIAVRIYDIWGNGGIYKGPIGIMTREKYDSWRSVTDDDGLSSSTTLIIRVLPPAPKNLNEFSVWPGTKQDIQFLWNNDVTSNAIESQNDAKISNVGEMIIGNGAYLGKNINDNLLKACQKSNQLTIEGVITISKMDQSGPARIISFSKDSGRRNFTLGQEGEYIVMRLRTPRTGVNGLNPQVSVCQITPNEPMHIVVSYYPGNLYCYLNGKLVYQGSDIKGDFRNWEACSLIFGDEITGDRNWVGKIKNISIYSRFIGPEEAALKYNLFRTD
jgi:hypothetical protein